ncbi:MAG: tetratricopeptide repeat protein [Pseudomonadota bacterium]
MTFIGAGRQARVGTFAIGCLAGLAVLAACSQPGITPSSSDDIDAPGVNLRKPPVDGILVGNRLVEAGEYELAIDAYTRAALDEGISPEINLGIGTANLGLGRLGQAETQLRLAVAEAPDWPEAWNNLGVLLMEKGDWSEAEGVFRQAYALDNGQSDSIRDNLRLALAKTEFPDNTSGQNEEFTLVRQGGLVLLTQTP